MAAGYGGYGDLLLGIGAAPWPVWAAGHYRTTGPQRRRGSDLAGHAVVRIFYSGSHDFPQTHNYYACR